MSLSEHSGRRLHTLVHGTAELLVPFFLAGIELRVNLSGFRDPSLILLAAVVLLMAIITKLAGCGLGALSLGKTDALRIGIGMIPRGEVGMVVAQLGLTLGVLSSNMYAVVVFAALATTLVAPPLLNLVYQNASAAPVPDALQPC